MGFFGDLLASQASNIGGEIGQAFGNRQRGSTIGGAVAPLLKLLPFQEGGQVMAMKALYGNPERKGLLMVRPMKKGGKAKKPRRK